MLDHSIQVDMLRKQPNRPCQKAIKKLGQRALGGKCSRLGVVLVLYKYLCTLCISHHWCKESVSSPNEFSLLFSLEFFLVASQTKNSLYSSEIMEEVQGAYCPALTNKRGHWMTHLNQHMLSSWGTSKMNTCFPVYISFGIHFTVL